MSGGTDVQNSNMVTMLGDALWTVNAGMQHSDPVTRANDSIVQSLLWCIQQLESSNAENVVLHQRIVDLETQAYQVQNLAAVHQKQETQSSDNPVVTDAVNKSAKCKRKQSKKSGKKSHLASSMSLSSQLSAESSDIESDGDTEALLSTSSQKRCGAPKSGQLVSPFPAKKESWTVWFARLEAIADDNELSGQERLSVLLPKLQGAAGKYVFEVLSKKIRLDYKKLV